MRIFTTILCICILSPFKIYAVKNNKNEKLESFLLEVINFFSEENNLSITNLLNLNNNKEIIILYKKDSSILAKLIKTNDTIIDSEIIDIHNNFFAAAVKLYESYPNYPIHFEHNKEYHHLKEAGIFISTLQYNQQYPKLMDVIYDQIYNNETFGSTFNFENLFYSLIVL